MPPSENFVDRSEATDQMMRDATLQQIIRANVRMVLSDFFGEVTDRIMDVEHDLHKRMERLEASIGNSQGDHIPMQASSRERLQRKEVSHHVDAPYWNFTYQKLPASIRHQPGAPQDFPPSPRHTGSSSVRESSSSAPRSWQAHQMPQAAPPPLHRTPGRVSSPRSAPRSSPCSTPRSTPRDSAGAQSSHDSRCRSQVPRRVGPSDPPMTVQGVLDWQTRQILEEADLIRTAPLGDANRAPRQQQRQRSCGVQSGTGGRTSVVPRAPTALGTQSMHSSPHVVEDDHDEAGRSEASTTKEKGAGRLQRMMGKHMWWSSRKTS